MLPSSTISFSAFRSSLDPQLQCVMPFSTHDHPTFSTHDHPNVHCHSNLICCFMQTLHQHQVLSSFSIFELYFTYCSHHRSLCPSQNSNLAFFLAQSSLPCRIAGLTISWKHPLSIQQLTTFHALIPPASCSGSHVRGTSSTCLHPVI